jgi:hypothetical protein
MQKIIQKKRSRTVSYVILPGVLLFFGMGTKHLESTGFPAAGTSLKSTDTIRVCGVNLQRMDLSSAYHEMELVESYLDCAKKGKPADAFMSVRIEGIEITLDGAERSMMPFEVDEEEWLSRIVHEIRAEREKGTFLLPGRNGNKDLPVESGSCMNAGAVTIAAPLQGHGLLAAGNIRSTVRRSIILSIKPAHEEIETHRLSGYHSLRNGYIPDGERIRFSGSSYRKLPANRIFLSDLNLHFKQFNFKPFGSIIEKEKPGNSMSNCPACRGKS